MAASCNHHHHLSSLVLLLLVTVSQASWFLTQRPARVANAVPHHMLHGQRDHYDRLISLEGGRHGKVHRNPGSIVPIERWSNTSYSSSAFNQWLTDTLSGSNGSRRAVMPLSHRCSMSINHQYKFIFISNRKAASTSGGEGGGMLANQLVITRGPISYYGAEGAGQSRGGGGGI